MDQGRLSAAAGLDVTVQGVVAGVEEAAMEPAGEGRLGIVKNGIPAPEPGNLLGSLFPEKAGLGQRRCMDIIVTTLHGRLPINMFVFDIFFLMALRRGP
jgi:hypothetical protein